MSRGRKPVSAHSCKCGQTDPQEFYKTRKAKCKKCVVEYTKNRLRKNPEINSAKIKYNLLYQQKNPFAYRMRAAQRRANAVGMVFDIDEEFLRELFDKQDGKCYYSGIPFQMDADTKARRYGLSIDRVDSSKGYTKDNVVLATSIINSMKNDLSVTEFMTVVQRLVDYQASIDKP